MIFSQEKEKPLFSLVKEIRSNFSYDSLSNISCLNAPPGVYALWFQVDKQGQFFNFKFSSDSLFDLKYFFIDAIKKSQSAIPAKERIKLIDKVLYQTIYFNNILSCHAWRDRNNNFISIEADSNLNLAADYNKEIIQLLGNQLASIENSIINFLINDIQKKSVLILPPAIINDINPNKKKQTGFYNDTRHRQWSDEEKKKIEEEIKKKAEELKKKRKENKLMSQQNCLAGEKFDISGIGDEQEMLPIPMRIEITMDSIIIFRLNL